MVQGVFISCNFWARYMYEMKTLGKNTEKHSTSKKGESLKLINLLNTISEKENLVLEGHKVSPPHPASSHSLIKY